MNRIFAIAKLTVKAAYRFRLVQVLTVLLIAAVVALPLVIKHDGTAQGFTQILLTYTLSAMTTLLGAATLWIGCGTLARDIEDSQIQMVAVKPIARWEIWLGKWVGILITNAFLIAVAGGAVFLLLQYRASKLPAEEQQKLRNEVLVARGSAKEVLPDFEPAVEKMFQERMRDAAAAAMDKQFVRKQIREQLKARFQVVPPNTMRPWKIDLGTPAAWLKDQPIYIRVKFNAAEKSPTGTFLTVWQVGPPGAKDRSRVWQGEKSFSADTVHEFEVPPNLFDDKGVMGIILANPNPTALLFPVEDSMEVLYREGGFGLNYARGLGVIFSWLALMALLGLAAASFLSFPVAAFASAAVLVVGLSSGTIAQVVEEGGISGVNHDTGRIDKATYVDQVALPIFKGLLGVVKLFQNFSPIDNLSSGRSITWTQLGMAWLQITGVIGGVFAIIGIFSFNRRELASAQGMS